MDLLSHLLSKYFQHITRGQTELTILFLKYFISPTHVGNFIFIQFYQLFLAIFIRLASFGTDLELRLDYS